MLGPWLTREYHVPEGEAAQGVTIVRNWRSCTVRECYVPGSCERSPVQ